MKHSPALRVWQEIHSYLNEADFGWQVLVLGACLLLALFGERLLRSHRPADSRAWELGQGGLQRIAFPLLALLLVLLARAAVQGWISVGLFAVAIPLLASLAAIRVVFYVLRVSLVGATWLASFERVFAMLVWAIVALHIIGLLPDLVALIESVGFNFGKHRLSLWDLLQGLVAVLVTVLAALWLSSAIEARLDRAAGLDDNLRQVFARLSRSLLVVLAVLIVLPMVGIDLTMLSVFGGALGVGLGLGLQKIASN